MSDKLLSSEKRTAYLLTLPAVLLVFAIILFPIFSNVWISFKEVELKDIRIPEPRAKKIVKIISEEPTKIKILYKYQKVFLGGTGIISRYDNMDCIYLNWLIEIDHRRGTGLKKFRKF